MSALSKVTSFFWNNPEVRVKVNEREGTLISIQEH